MSVIIYKPDALSGLSGMVSALRAESFMIALAVHCGAKRTVPTRMLAAVGRARRQIAERASTELSFVVSVRNPDACQQRLLAWVSQARRHGRVGIPEIATTGIEGLGFYVRSTAEFVCNETDVDGIYPSVSASRYESIRRALVAYLVGSTVRVLCLGGDQNSGVLQHWKTYVRHLFQNRRNGRYRLRNLVHVCENSDEMYLMGRLQGLHKAIPCCREVDECPERI